jgi:ribonuclease P protein component
VFRQGQRSADRFFTVLYRPNALDMPRLGFAISRKKVRHATDRNRLKRVVRESFRIRYASCHLSISSYSPGMLLKTQPTLNCS